MATPLNKRRFIGLAVAVCVIVVAILTLRHIQGPVSGNEQLKIWTLRAYSGDTTAVAFIKGLGTNGVPDLTRLLETRDSIFRKQAWAGLRKLSAPSRQAIAGHFPPPGAEAVREAAARSLGLLGPEARSAIPALTRALRDKEGRVRGEAANALVRIGKDSMPSLIAALDDKDAGVRQEAAGALGGMGTNANAALPALVQRLGDPNERVRNVAAYSLTTLGPSGTQALIDAAKRGDEPARQTAANLLTNAYPALLGAASSFFNLAHDKSPGTRRQAIEAIGYILRAKGLAMAAAMEALMDPVVEVRLAAIKTIGKAGGTAPGAILALMGCLKDESPSVREQASAALGNMGKPADSAVSDLIRLTQDPENSVRSAARRAVSQIRPEEPLK